MKSLLFVCVIALMATVTCRPAFATKEFGEHFGKFYVADSKSDDFKKLVAEAKCNVCHIEGEAKKKHNPYGETLKASGLLKKPYMEMIKSDPDKARKEIEEILKKCEEKKADGKDKTFGERIKAGMLPGGDIKGKQSTDKLISFNSPVVDFVELFDGKSMDVLEPAAKDNEWYTQEIIVQDKQITLKVNGKTLVEYTEPKDQEVGKDFERKLGEGTFALQAHDPGSKVYFKNLMVKRLD